MSAVACAEQNCRGRLELEGRMSMACIPALVCAACRAVLAAQESCINVPVATVPRGEPAPHVAHAAHAALVAPAAHATHAAVTHAAHAAHAAAAHAAHKLEDEECDEEMSDSTHLAAHIREALTHLRQDPQHQVQPGGSVVQENMFGLLL